MENNTLAIIVAIIGAVVRTVIGGLLLVGMLKLFGIVITVWTGILSYAIAKGLWLLLNTGVDMDN